MKKLLMMAAIAALSSSAWADWSYQIDIIHLESGTIAPGTIPSTIKATLVDKSKVGTGDYVLSFASIDFTKVVGQSWFDENGRFRIVDYINENPGKTFDTMTTGAGSIKLSRDAGANEYQAQYTAALGDSASIFPSDALSDQNKQAAYALENLRTIFTVDGKDYELVAKYNVGGAQQLGTTAMLKEIPTPVPEPTSGMLAMLGLAGLMLRRRAA